jgi:hypothetical protein
MRTLAGLYNSCSLASARSLVKAASTVSPPIFAGDVQALVDYMVTADWGVTH